MGSSFGSKDEGVLLGGRCDRKLKAVHLRGESKGTEQVVSY